MLLFHLLNKKTKARKATTTATTESKKSDRRASPLCTRLELLELAQLQHYHRLKKIERRLKKIQDALLEDSIDEDDEMDESTKVR